jgi:hypothetical protein
MKVVNFDVSTCLNNDSLTRILPSQLAVENPTLRLWLIAFSALFDVVFLKFCFVTVMAVRSVCPADPDTCSVRCLHSAVHWPPDSESYHNWPNGRLMNVNCCIFLSFSHYILNFSKVF